MAHPENAKKRVSRVCIRDDGKVFSFNESLAKKDNFRTGWTYLGDDGVATAVPDRKVIQMRASEFTPEREQKLLDEIQLLTSENEALKARLAELLDTPMDQIEAEYLGDTDTPVLDTEAGESAIDLAEPTEPPEPDGIPTIVHHIDEPIESLPQVSEEDEVITLTPDPDPIPESKLKTMNKAAIVSHIKLTDRTATPDMDMTKAELIAMAVDVQTSDESTE